MKCILCCPAMVEGTVEKVFARVVAYAPDEAAGMSWALARVKSCTALHATKPLLLLDFTWLASLPPCTGMDGTKRKHGDEGTLVTFYAPGRTFARVYKGP